MRESPEGAIANSLWRHYETALPDTPYQMALLIAHQLRQEGHLKPCRHVYEYVRTNICPDCGRDTHEPDYARFSQEFQDHYQSGKHLSSICPIDGGTLRGWWSI